jgi:tripartite-type tricarboxylate transporter receptor subunit TctC
VTLTTISGIACGHDQAPLDGDVPTLGKRGVAGGEIAGWQGIIGPRGIALVFANRLNAVFNEVQTIADVTRSMESDGYQLEAGTPEEFAAFIDDEYERWGSLIREAGIQL